MFFFSFLLSLFSGISELDYNLSQQVSDLSTLGTLTATFFSLFASIFSSFFTTILVAIAVVIYNLVSGFIGPLELEAQVDLPKQENSSFDEGRVLQIVRREINEKERERTKQSQRTELPKQEDEEKDTKQNKEKYSEEDFMPQAQNPDSDKREDES